MTQHISGFTNDIWGDDCVGLTSVETDSGRDEGIEGGEDCPIFWKPLQAYPHRIRGGSTSLLAHHTNLNIIIDFDIII